MGPEGELLWKQLMYVMFFFAGANGKPNTVSRMAVLGRVLSHHRSLYSISCITGRFFSIRKEAPSILDRQGTNQCKTQPDDSSTTEINVQ